MLSSWGEGPLPGGDGEARIAAEEWDLDGGDVRPVPADDEALAAAAPYVGTDDGAAIASSLSGPRAYVRLRRDLPTRRALAELQSSVPEGVEVRALLAKPKDRRVAAFVALFPHTPPHLQERLWSLESFATAAEPLIEMAGTCGKALLAFEPVKQGIDIRELAPSMSDAIGACGCDLADLDGFVSLFAWLTLPLPEVGWLPLDEAAR